MDPSQLENALLNLRINTRDTMPGGGRIGIGASNQHFDARAAQEHGLAPGEYVVLCVTDSGTGMPPAVAAKALEPFFTTKPIGKGTCLGLSMTDGFARQSGSQVRITSEVGRGTTVCLYLPRNQDEAEPEAAAPDLAYARQTVLVVDGEPTVRMLVSEVLEDLGYTAMEAEDGAAGLKILQPTARIHLLVTGIGLPDGINGRQVAEAGRAIRPNLKILFITGKAEHAMLDQANLAPGMQILSKPLALEALASRIEQALQT